MSICKLMVIINTEFREDAAEAAHGLSVMLQDMLNEIDAIDPDTPCHREAMGLLAPRVKLVVSAAALMLQRQLMSELA